MGRDGVDHMGVGGVGEWSSCHRYQLRWTDVCYMEEVKRSLTSLQMSIRSVVAASNSQASRLHDDITKLQDALKVSETDMIFRLFTSLYFPVWRPHPRSGGTSPSR